MKECLNVKKLNSRATALHLWLNFSIKINGKLIRVSDRKQCNGQKKSIYLSMRKLWFYCNNLTIISICDCTHSSINSIAFSIHPAFNYHETFPIFMQTAIAIRKQYCGMWMLIALPKSYLMFCFTQIRVFWFCFKFGIKWHFTNMKISLLAASHFELIGFLRTNQLTYTPSWLRTLALIITIIDKMGLLLNTESAWLSPYIGVSKKKRKMNIKIKITHILEADNFSNFLWSQRFQFVLSYRWFVHVWHVPNISNIHIRYTYYYVPNWKSIYPLRSVAYVRARAHTLRRTTAVLWL